jgi:molybdate transport system regulatory protein
VTTEVVVRLQDGTEVCSIITEKSKRTLDIQKNDTMWVAFSVLAVVIHTD